MIISHLLRNEEIDVEQELQSAFEPRINDFLVTIQLNYAEFGLSGDGQTDNWIADVDRVSGLKVNAGQRIRSQTEVNNSDGITENFH